MLDHIPWLYALSGALVGFFVGLTGVGGGSLMTPILILVFGFAPVTAVGTDQLFASVTKTVGSSVHGYNRTVDWRVVGRLAVGSLPGAIITLIGLYYLRITGGAANALVTKVLSIALLFTAASLILRPWLVRLYQKRVGPLDRTRTIRLTILTGFVLGVLVSLTSVGAGALGVTALILLYPDLPIGRIVGSDIAHAVPLTLVAGLGHWLQGSVDLKLLSSLLVGSVPGIALGSYLVPKMPEIVLRLILAAILLFVSARFLLQ
jgi:uncharacterized membrane protein YfcA